MSLSSVSSALSLNERWVLLYRQPRGPRPPHHHPDLASSSFHPSDLQSSEELTAPRSESPRLLHLKKTNFPIITTTKVEDSSIFLTFLYIPTVLSPHPRHITLNQSELPTLYSCCISSYLSLLSQELPK